MQMVMKTDNVFIKVE